MNLVKFLIVGAAVGIGVNYLVSKKSNGRSILDDISDNAPDWFDKAKQLGKDALNKADKSAHQAY